MLDEWDDARERHRVATGAVHAHRLRQRRPHREQNRVLHAVRQAPAAPTQRVLRPLSM